MADPYYITTAIAYPNGKPHIGHAYEAIAADAIARFHRMQGKDVRLVTGTDEHGLKMAQTARAAGKDTLEFATEMSDHFREMCARLNVQYDAFCRTTEERHKAASVALWKAMEASDDLYLDRYEGWYSVRDEAFYGEKELIAGEGGEKLSPQGTPVEWTVEESWFFRLSKYRDFLIELNETPGFLEPESRRNEVLAFLKGNDLRDLSVSRTSFDWGVPVPGSPGHVMYVWVDALTTYLTGIGYPDREGDFSRFWPADLHLIGKDIVRFHAVYWPAFLKSARLPVPKKIFGHGFLLARGGEKMSKSLGNVVDPVELADKYGVDQLRYFLLREVSFGSDGTWSEEAIVTRCNAELANGYGNLVQRTFGFISKFLDGNLPAEYSGEAPCQYREDYAFVDGLVSDISCFQDSFASLEPHLALQFWNLAIFKCNAFIDEMEPWKLRKSDPERMGNVLALLVWAIRDLTIAVRPVTPFSASLVLAYIEIPESDRTYGTIKIFDPAVGMTWDRDWYRSLRENTKTIAPPTPIFPRLEMPAEDAPQ
ncbi:MAG: methionine--tRNA ligase [Novosphingobium sp.]